MSNHAFHEIDNNNIDHSNYDHVDDNFEELLTELSSLGITVTRLNDLNDSEELNHLIDNIKLTLYQDYKAAYSSI